MAQVLAVLTGKPKERLHDEGGTADWLLNPAVVRGMKHVVCVRHGHPPYDPGPGDRSEPHGAAFLVAEIADLVFTKTEKGRDRYMVTFAGVADVLVPDFWDGSRNPVRYMDADEVKARGIDIDALEFEPFDAPAPKTGASPLTIAEAKLGLSVAFGVPVDAIEITIRG
jgi:hypothetical protein